MQLNRYALRSNRIVTARFVVIVGHPCLFRSKIWMKTVNISITVRRNLAAKIWLCERVYELETPGIAEI